MALNVRCRAPVAVTVLERLVHLRAAYFVSVLAVYDDAVPLLYWHRTRASVHPEAELIDVTALNDVEVLGEPERASHGAPSQVPFT
jgi:hypothetical protein